MRTIKTLGLPILFITYLMISVPLQSCDPDDDDNEPDTSIVVYKPNIYIYPNELIQLTVKLEFPMGGNIVTSIPEYGTAWNFSVDTNGLIDDTYTYLFYESTQPDIWQKDNGWIIKKNDLETFFRDNMTKYGFFNQEIEDFIDYWIPRLNDYHYFSICPQTKEIIDDVITLSFSKQPKNVLRLFYLIKGYDNLPNKLVEPTIDKFTREDFFVAEWGVILK